MTEVKIVINRCYGGFGFSDEGMALLAARKGYTTREEREGESESFVNPEGGRIFGYELEHELPRTDADLVAVVEELGDAAGGSHSDLIIKTLPKGTRYMINEYDGAEWLVTEANLTEVA